MDSYINSPAVLDYLKANRNELSDLFKEMEEYAVQNKVPVLNWKASELLELVTELRAPKDALEIGMAIAYSAIKMSLKMPADGKLDTIEKSTTNLPVAKNFIERAGMQDKINILFGEAEEIMAKSDKMYDFIFLDVDKIYYEKLFHLSMKLLKPGGIFFVDNLLWKGYVAVDEVPDEFKTSTELVKNFNNMFLNHPDLDPKIYPIGDGIGVAVRRK